MIDAAFAAYMKQHGDTIAGRKVVLIKRDDTGIALDERQVSDKRRLAIAGVRADEQHRS